MLAEGGVVCASRAEGPAVDIIRVRHDPLVAVILAWIGGRPPGRSWAQWRGRSLTNKFVCRKRRYSFNYTLYRTRGGRWRGAGGATGGVRGLSARSASPATSCARRPLARSLYACACGHHPCADERCRRDGGCVQRRRSPTHANNFNALVCCLCGPRVHYKSLY